MNLVGTIFRMNLYLVIYLFSNIWSFQDEPIKIEIDKFSTEKSSLLSSSNIGNNLGPGYYRDLNSTPYYLVIKKITSKSFEIKITGKPTQEHNFNISIFTALVSKEIPKANCLNCSGFKVSNLQPATIYNIILETKPSKFSKQSVNTILTKHNVSFDVFTLSSTTASIVISFTPNITSAKNSCHMTLMIESMKVQTKLLKLCNEIYLKNLLTFTNYTVMITYINYTYSTIFSLIHKNKENLEFDYTIKLQTINLKCSKVEIEVEYTPKVNNWSIFTCKSNLNLTSGSLLDCNKLNCKTTCNRTTYENLTPDTSYTFTFESNIKYPPIMKFLEFRTMKLLQAKIIISKISYYDHYYDIRVHCEMDTSFNCLVTIISFPRIWFYPSYHRYDCCNRTIAHSGPYYPVYLLKIEVTPTDGKYCGSIFAWIPKDYTISAEIEAGIVTAYVKVSFEPSIVPLDASCSIMVSSKDINIYIQHSFDCKSINLTMLTPNTTYHVNITYLKFINVTEFQTKIEHLIIPKFINITCDSIKICNIFKPHYPNLTYSECQHMLQSSNKMWLCSGEMCSHSCECLSFENLAPNTVYNYTVSSIPELTSKKYTDTFNIMAINPFNILQDSSNYSTVDISINGSAVSNYPSCYINISSKIINYKNSLKFDACQKIKLFGLQPMQKYSVTMIPIPNIYCSFAQTIISTSEIIRRINITETKTNAITLSSSYPFEDHNIQDDCFYSIYSLQLRVNTSYAPVYCLKFTIIGLISGSKYLVTASNKLSTKVYTYVIKTKFPKPGINHSLSIEKSIFYLRWENNNDINTSEVRYEGSIYFLGSKIFSMSRKPLIEKKFIDSNSVELNFTDINKTGTHRIDLCTIPSDDTCNNITTFDKSCISCFSRIFFHIPFYKYDKNKAIFHESLNLINISNFGPIQNPLFNVYSCFVSLAPENKTFNTKFKFYDVPQGPKIHDNLWVTIMVLNASACIKSNFMLIPLISNEGKSLQPILGGYNYFIAVTYCSYTICYTPYLDVKLYIDITSPDNNKASSEDLIYLAFLVLIPIVILIVGTYIYFQRKSTDEFPIQYFSNNMKQRGKRFKKENLEINMQKLRKFFF